MNKEDFSPLFEETILTKRPGKAFHHKAMENKLKRRLFTPIYIQRRAPVPQNGLQSAVIRLTLFAGRFFTSEIPKWTSPAPREGFHPEVNENDNSSNEIKFKTSV